MLEQITKNPDLTKYMTTFKEGEILFLEGDDSQDLFILVSGSVDFLKGSKKISEVEEPGAVFGEISFLLGGKRTASAKATDQVKALCIPKEKITSFLTEFPEVGNRITRHLAHRLDETSQILTGLKEFCDQLPDAVVLTDREGKIMSWNSAAERLYGRGWEQMHDRSMEEIYEEPQAYRSFLEEVQSRYSIREKILKIKHPERGSLFVSTSTTILYDGHHNFQGVLSLGRDVTSIKKLETRYRRLRNWLIPSVVLLALLGGSLFFVSPYISKGIENVDVRKHEVRSQFAKDYLLLKSLLLDVFRFADRTKSTPVLREFFKLIDPEQTVYSGIVLLDREKRVFDYSSPEAGPEDGALVGSSYAGIDFQGSDRSPMRLLVLYRADKEHPMGRRSIELAFEIENESQVLGWLVFQLKMDLLKRKYSVTEEDFRKFQIRKPQQ
ncbi:MAG: PAS domain S-box protein [Desulfobacteraceae bacterium]|nr:MAG: PAS domain S-box protein [Desulfobacteraceae bacterium]